MSRPAGQSPVELDPVTLSVFVSSLTGIAEEMGAVLIRSSYSSNIKERRDCSCALFDGTGRMIAQAEHIPIHLGAMYDSVRAVMARSPEPGDLFILNNPYEGGTHLPDITLVSPVDVDGVIIGYAVSRAHHSDVGGATPGSMPSDSRSIFQEGIVIPPLHLARRGVLAEELLEFLLANVRTPEIRRADLMAQAAANSLGAERLLALAERHGLEFMHLAFDEVIAYSDRQTREALRAIPTGTYRATGEIEGDGVSDLDFPICVAVTIDDGSIHVDFAGTAEPVSGNINCPRSVTLSACLFALQVLLPTGVPLNAGSTAPLTLSIPEPSLVDAQWPSAVVAGNVETSQRIADIVLEALGQAVDLPAAGQGTMNNLIIGGDDWTYYETIGGGQGASRNGPGQSGIHVGMSNTLNTPIEALELELPLRVERYQLRYESGGAGLHPGGDGIERRIRVVQPATLSMLGDRRRNAPAGKAGGCPGACGANLLDDMPLPPKYTGEITSGQVVTVLTPGGGGFGPPDDKVAGSNDTAPASIQLPKRETPSDEIVA